MERALRLLRIAVLAVTGALTAMFVYVVASRVAFPYELEWMCGSVLDHVERVQRGLPVYTAPSMAWIPYLYPPLFYWIAAPLGGGFVACRVVSIVAALLQAACVWRLSRRFGATTYWAVVGVLAFFACFFYVGYWYDVERSDTLCIAFVLVAAVLVTEARATWAAVAAGALVGLGVFAKQQALPFAIGGAAGLLLARQWVRGVAFGAAAGAVVSIVTKVEDVATGGWFSWYVFRMPAHHGMDLRLWHDVMDYDVPRGAVLIAVTIGVVAHVGWRAVKHGERDDLVFAALVATGGATALSSRLHVGGWINVLQPWTSFACPALAVAATRADATGRLGWRMTAPALVLVQAALWLHSPSERVPDATLRADTERFLGAVKALEKDGGEVLLVGRGHVTRERHFQMSGLADVVRMGPPPADLVAALAARKLVAVIDDARGPSDPPLGLWSATMLEDVPELRTALFANYFAAERYDDRDLRIAMPAPAMPRWLYRPRREPLALTGAALDRRHFAEMALADRRSLAVRIGQPPPFEIDRIEELAREAGF